MKVEITKCWTNKVDAFNRFYGEKSCALIRADGKISFEPEITNEGSARVFLFLVL